MSERRFELFILVMASQSLSIKILRDFVLQGLSINTDKFECPVITCCSQLFAGYATHSISNLSLNFNTGYHSVINIKENQSEYYLVERRL
jgi:hypothetical protein